MIFLDSDVLLDVGLARQPYAQPMVELLNRLERNQDLAFIAWHTVSNLFYLMNRVHRGAAAREFILELLRFVQVAPTGAEAVRYAASLPVPDFEDAMQIAAARACGADCIVTRNLRDYERSPIPAITPQEALDRLR